MSSPVVDSDKADPPFQGTQLEPEGDKASSTVEQSERSKGDEQWETDPANARNWSARRKWLNIFIVSRAPPRGLCVIQWFADLLVYSQPNVRQLYDGTWSPSNCCQIRYHKPNGGRSDTEHIPGHICVRGRWVLFLNGTANLIPASLLLARLCLKFTVDYGFVPLAPQTYPALSNFG